MDTRETGQQLVALCREGRNLDAVNTLYSPDIVSVEAQTPPGMAAEAKGLDAIRGKNKWWFENHEIHSAKAEGPYVLGDRFSVHYNYDITPKTGEGSGKRVQMNEVALYTVKDGKVVHEEFMY